MTSSTSRSDRIRSKSHIFALDKSQLPNAHNFIIQYFTYLYFIFQNFISLQHENCFTQETEGVLRNPRKKRCKNSIGKMVPSDA